MNKHLFKGGPVTMRSGGIGPDDYMFRINRPRHRWVYVYMRYKLEEGGRMAYEEDKACLNTILCDCERVCLSDLQQILSKRTTVAERVQLYKHRNSVMGTRCMSVSEFLHTSENVHD